MRVFTIGWLFLLAGLVIADDEQSKEHGWLASACARIFPANDFVLTIPPSSATSPAYLEGTYIDGVLPKASVDDVDVPVLPLSPARFFLEVPLSAGDSLSLQVTGMTTSQSTLLDWLPTPVKGFSSLTIRCNDSLLFTAPTDGTWRIEKNGGDQVDERAMSSGDRWPYQFAEPGCFRVIARSADGEVAGIVQVIAVDELFPGGTVPSGFG